MSEGLTASLQRLAHCEDNLQEARLRLELAQVGAGAIGMEAFGQCNLHAALA